MKTSVDPAEVTINFDNLRDEELYQRVSNKLDGLGKLVSLYEPRPDLTRTHKSRTYFFNGSVVSLSETISTAVNHYQVDVRMDIYSNSRNAKQVSGMLKRIAGQPRKN